MNFEEVRAAIHSDLEVELPQDWENDEVIASYIKGYLPSLEWNIKGDIFGDDGRIMMSNFVLPRAERWEEWLQVAVWPVRLWAYEKYCKSLYPTDKRPLKMLELRRKRLLGEHVGKAEWGVTTDAAWVTAWGAAYFTIKKVVEQNMIRLEQGASYEEILSWDVIELDIDG